MRTLEFDGASHQSLADLHSGGADPGTRWPDQHCDRNGTHVIPRDFWPVDGARTQRSGRGAARLLRRTEHLRRQSRRLVPGSGVRACSGSLLRDGFPPSPRRRAALGTLRQLPAGNGCVRPHARLAASGRAGAGAARAVDAPLSRRVRRWRERLSRGPISRRPLAGVFAAQAARPALHARQPWTAVDSVAWLKVMAWDLASNLTQEADRAIITGKLGAGRAASLFPRYPLDDDFAPIVRRGDVVGKTFDPTASRSSARPLPERPEQ